jgi:hypothetical protein
MDLGTAPKPIADGRLIATVTLVASTAAKDGSGITLSAGGKDSELLPGIPVRFERVDLSKISASGKSGDSLSIFGHTDG